MPAHASFVTRACAGFDLVVTGLLSLPFTARVFVSALYASSGAQSAPELPGIAWFFVNLAGALGVLWALVRIAGPEPWLARADALGRCAVATLIAGYLIAGALPALMAAFVASELIGAAAQAWVLGRRVPQA
jgi:hypothetical protein